MPDAGSPSQQYSERAAEPPGGSGKTHDLLSQPRSDRPRSRDRLDDPLRVRPAFGAVIFMLASIATVAAGAAWVLAAVNAL